MEEIFKIKRLPRLQGGFTLVEILVALLIYSILGVITVVGLHTMIRSHHQLQKTDDKLTQLMSAMAILRRDITQMIARPITSKTGEGALPAFLSISTTEFEFTRAGYTNPMMIEPRSTLQRVAYQFENNTLKRISWPVLDRAPDTQALSRVILDDVEQMSISFVDDTGQEVQSWSSGAGGKAIPHAIILTLKLKTLGELSGVFAIPSRGPYDPNE